MSAATKYLLAPAGSTGNLNPGVTVDAGPASGAVCFQFVVEAAGATPTITYKFQGSMDGANWYDVQYITDTNNTGVATAKTATAVGGSISYLDAQSGARNYTKYRLIATLNTNITFRAELYVFSETDI